MAINGNGRRFFLTGCTGWLGLAIVSELCRRTDTESITLLTRNPQARWSFYGIDKRIALYEGDINTGQFPTGDFTHIIHGANPPASADPHGVYYAIVDGTERILEWAHRVGAANFLLLSSGASKDRTTAYGKAKAVAERLLPSGAAVARIYTLIGYGVPIQYAVGTFIFQALNDGRVRCNGGELVYRSYLHLEDAARWALAIMDQRRRADVGGALPYTVNEVAQIVAGKFGVPCVHEPDDTKRGSYLPDLNEALSIGCTTTIPLGTALERIRDEARIRYPHLESSKAA